MSTVIVAKWTHILQFVCFLPFYGMEKERRKLNKTMSRIGKLSVIDANRMRWKSLRFDVFPRAAMSLIAGNRVVVSIWSMSTEMVNKCFFFFEYSITWLDAPKSILIKCKSFKWFKDKWVVNQQHQHQQLQKKQFIFHIVHDFLVNCSSLQFNGNHLNINEMLHIQSW